MRDGSLTDLTNDAAQKVLGDSVVGREEPTHVKLQRKANIGTGTKLFMILTGYIPLAHAVFCAFLFVAVVAAAGPAWGVATALSALYIAPALLVRSVRRVAAVPNGRYGPATITFRLWWFCAQCQLLFNRLPILEECLRVVPGLYSAWIRLWGSRVGSLVYWAPGVVVFDRQLLRIGHRVAFGGRAHITPHYMAKDDDGCIELCIAPITIGDDALVGGLSLVPAGATIEPGGVTRVRGVVKPFEVYGRTSEV